MGLVINKAKSLIKKPGNEIRYISHVEKKGIEMVKEIAKSFGDQSKKNKPKKIYFR